MIFRDIVQLAIYQTEGELDTIPLENLRSLYLEKTSEIIYFLNKRKLYGVVCMKEALFAHDDEEKVVKINKSFTVIRDVDVIKAHKIFQTKLNIHNIPIVNDMDELIGDYSVWDDMLYIKRNHKRMMKEGAVKRVLEGYGKVYIVKPVVQKYSIYLQFASYMERFGVEHQILEKEQITGRMSNNSCFIFADEDERRGTECLYGISPCLYDIRGKYIYRYDLLQNIEGNIKFVTYASFMIQIAENEQFDKLKIKKQDNFYGDLIDDKATVLLSALSERGVNCFCLYDFEDKDIISEYCVNFQEEVKERMAKYPISLKKPWPKKNENPDFFGELYQYKDYENEIVQQETCFPLSSFKYRDSIVSKYCNAKNGRRVTCFQPCKYIGTIYILGRCMMLGIFTEDQYTIASILQKKLLEKGFLYRVENCADMLRLDCSIDERFQEIGNFYTNDIVVFLSSSPNKVVSVPGMALEKIYEEHRIPSTWVSDNQYAHCNYKVNHIVADEIMNMISHCLVGKTVINNKKVQFCIQSEMQKYVKCNYLEQYFSTFDGRKYTTVGAIVLECNPFNLEHRYWIERAYQQVDFLILFIIERDILTFSFEERFRMAVDGTKDLKNMIVAPSGMCILSEITFPEYLLKGEKRAVVYNARYDINVFADYIAYPLHITHRFGIKESKRANEEIYMEEMQHIFPRKGITYAEIPGKLQEQDNYSIRVMKYLRDKEYIQALGLFPETTKKFFMEQFKLEV